MGDLQKDREKKKRGGERHKTVKKTEHTVIIPVRRKGGVEVKTDFWCRLSRPPTEQQMLLLQSELLHNFCVTH